MSIHAEIIAVIYCRVSSERQSREGGGLKSQEQRCRQYAEARGYRVVAVFVDDGVSGALLDRPGVRQLISFLKESRGSVVVIVDDISRVARDVKTHLELRTMIAAARGVLESPSMKFEDNAMGEMVEVIFAAVAQYGRTGNREQVLNRQKARLQLGYWTFPAPPGYRYVKHPVHKKLLEPTAEGRKILGPALESFASNSSATARDLAAKLEAQGFFGGGPVASIRTLEKRVGRILANMPIYAGFIEYPQWGVVRAAGQHSPLVSKLTLFKIEERLPVRNIGGDRADSDDRLILRNFIRCPECGRPFTGCLAKGKYPRYFCYFEGRCARYGHSISARILVPAFEALLQKAKPKDEVFEAIRLLSLEAYAEEVRSWDAAMTGNEEKLRSKTEEIRLMTRRLAKTADDDIALGIEDEIKTLKHEASAIELEALTYSQSLSSFEAAFERVSTLFRDPYSYWKNGSDKQKKTVHRVVFTVAPSFDRISGFSTCDLTLPYRISSECEGDPGRLVEVTGETWHQFSRNIFDWSELVREAGIEPDHLDGLTGDPNHHPRAPVSRGRAVALRKRTRRRRRTRYPSSLLVARNSPVSRLR